MNPLKKLFDSPTPVTPKAAPQKITPMRPTKKRKITYIVKLNGIMADTSLFSLCRNTPLAVIEKDGQPQQSGSGFLACTEFPNPAAAHMQANYSLFAPYIGEKLACTIVEYQDKANGKPVAYLFPNHLIVSDGYENDYMSHLNHATRRDLARQIEIRKKCLEKLQNHNIRTSC